MSDIEIHNPDHLPAQFVLDEIAQIEKEKGRRVVKIEFTDLGDGTCKEKVWLQHVDFQRLRRVTGFSTLGSSHASDGLYVR